MKLKFKRNKLYIIVFFVCLLIFVFYALEETNIFFIVKKFLSDPSYKKSYIENSAGTNINGILDVIRDVLTRYPWTFDSEIVWGTNMFQLLLPFFASVASVKFYQEYTTIFQLEMYREKKTTQKFLFRKVFKTASHLALAIFLAYLVFYFLTLWVTKGVLMDGFDRELFNEVYPEFYENSPYIYYIVEGLVRFLLMPFIYAFFACAIALFAQNQKLVLLVPNIYYFGLSTIAFGLYYVSEKISLYINPTTIMVVGSYENLSSILLIIISCLPFWLGVGLIYWRSKYAQV